MKKLSVGVFIFIGLATASIARAAGDVGPYYWLFKRVNVRQTSTGAPALAPAPYQLFSLVEIAFGGQFMVSGNSLTPPSGSGSGIRPYSLIRDGSPQFTTFFSSQAQLDSTFLAGNYQLDLRGTPTNYLPLLNLKANTTYSTVTPKLSNSNFKSGQLVVDAAAPVTLSWNSFSDRNPNGNDVIVLIITNEDTTLFRGVLPANTTSKTFAANFFKKEQSYTVDLSFVKVAERNTTSIAGSTGLTGYAKATQIFISTSTRTPITGLGNISTRALVGTGDNVLICGFIITSTDTAPLSVVVRAIGPSLATAGITNPLLDPTIALLDGNGQLIASSDDWRNNIPDRSQVFAVGLAPRDPRESALYRNLVPGNYTAIVRGKNNTTGVGLAEVYNIGSNGNAKLANISTRGQVLTDDNVLIGGLIVKGPFNHSVLFRALGPSLTGVAGVLANPKIQLFNQQGATLAANNNWRDTQETQIQATMIAPPHDNEAAILITLTPGAYTAIVRGAGDLTGVALVEAYTIN